MWGQSLGMIRKARSLCKKEMREPQADRISYNLSRER